jgi:lysophospholipase L1-like esterase
MGVWGSARWRRPVLAAVTLLGATAVALGLAEGVVRVLGLTSAVRGHFKPGIYAPDSALGWALQPSYRGVRFDNERSALTTTNALGFRGPEWDGARRAAGLRVLVLGDSCTFGLGVADEETYPAQLEQDLRKRGRDAAVFNAGVPGYDTVQEADLLDRLSTVVRPHFVVVTWLPNDLLRAGHERDRAIRVIDGYLVDDLSRYHEWRRRIDQKGIYRSALYRFVRVRVRLLKDRLGWRRRSWLGEADPEHFRLTTAAVTRIGEASAGLGAQVVLALIPRREQAEGSAGLADLRYMADFGRASGMRVVDPMETWLAGDVDVRRYYLADNVHLTGLGYGKLGEATAQAVVYNGTHSRGDQHGDDRR